MKKIKESFLKKKSQSALNRMVRVVKPDQVKTLLLIVNEESKTSKRLVEDLFSNASVHMLFERAIKTDSTVGFYYSVHDSDFNLTGNLKNDKLLNLSKMQFELLLDLSSDSELLSYFSKNSTANFKVGNMNRKDIQTFDLLIEYGKTDAESIKQIFSTLITITKNG
jgi:hypothetical protein